MGASASARLDIPAYASLDWVHQFNDRLSLGASATWTEWSSFQDLTLKSHGNTIVSIPYTYRNTWTLAVGGDYKVTDQWTMRAGVAYDQTPTHNATRDPRIPDGDRYFASLGAGYRFQSMPELSIDAAYSRQFVKEVPLKTVNQDRLGGGRLDGRATSKGQVFSLSATYDFCDPAVGRKGLPGGEALSHLAPGCTRTVLSSPFNSAWPAREAAWFRARALARAVLADPESFSFAP